jgi:hypothetical protein
VHSPSPGSHAKPAIKRASSSTSQRGGRQMTIPRTYPKLDSHSIRVVTLRVGETFMTPSNAPHFQKDQTFRSGWAGSGLPGRLMELASSPTATPSMSVNRRPIKLARKIPDLKRRRGQTFASSGLPSEVPLRAIRGRSFSRGTGTEHTLSSRHPGSAFQVRRPQETSTHCSTRVLMSLTSPRAWLGSLASLRFLRRPRPFNL